MRDRRLVAMHRGGTLDPATHRLLAAWAADCAERVLPLFHQQSSDLRPYEAIEKARAWARGEIAVGAAQKAAVAAHAAACAVKNGAAVAAALAICVAGGIAVWRVLPTASSSSPSRK